MSGSSGFGGGEGNADWRRTKVHVGKHTGLDLGDLDEESVRALIDRYASGERAMRRGETKADAPLEYPETGVYHPHAKGKIGDSTRLLAAATKLEVR